VVVYYIERWQKQKGAQCSNWPPKQSTYTNQQLHHYIQQSPVLWKARLFPSLKDESQLWPSLLWAIDLQLLVCLNKHPSQVFKNKVEMYQHPYFSIRCRRLVTFECFHNTLLKITLHHSFTSCTKVEMYQHPYFSIRCRRLVTFECFHNTLLKITLHDSFTSCTKND